MRSDIRRARGGAAQDTGTGGVPGRSICPMRLPVSDRAYRALPSRQPRARPTGANGF
jgi:hypothetical protein